MLRLLEWNTDTTWAKGFLRRITRKESWRAMLIDYTPHQEGMCSVTVSLLSFAWKPGGRTVSVRHQTDTLTLEGWGHAYVWRFYFSMMIVYYCIIKIRNIFFAASVWEFNLQSIFHLTGPPKQTTKAVSLPVNNAFSHTLWWVFVFFVCLFVCLFQNNLMK